MMTQSAVPRSTRRTVLCATDLSFRCDRALERALLIARQWDAKLVLLTVVDSPNESAGRGYPWCLTSLEARREAEQRLRREVVASDVDVSFRVGEGSVAPAIVHAADEERCDLVVLGVSKSGAFRRLFLGSTVDSLVRRSPIPVLVVQNRARGPYGSIVVPSDFQAPSRRALETAADFFPSVQLSLFHAFHIPYSGIADVPLQKAEVRRRDEILAAHRTFIGESSLGSDVARKIRPVIKYGPPAPLLSRYVAEEGVDLVALATHARPPLLDFALSGVAQSILEEVRTDVVVVSEGART